MKRSLWIVIGVGLTLLVLAMIRHSTIVDREWEELQSRLDVIKAQQQLTGEPRPVLWGASRPGAAADIYERALRKRPIPHGAPSRWLQSRRPGVPSASVAEGLVARDRAVTDAGEILAAIREGAHARLPFRSCSTAENNSWIQDQAVEAVKLTVLRADAAIDDDEQLDAARWLLDGAQFSVDRLRHADSYSLWVGRQCVEICTWDALCGAGALLGELDQVALAELDRGLAKLEASYPQRLTPATEPLLAFHRDGDWVRRFGGMHRRAWRYGFSVKLMVATQVREVLDLQDAWQATSHEPWARRLVMLRSFGSGPSVTGGFNPHRNLFRGSANQLELQLRALDRLRMTRIAVRKRLDGSDLELPSTVRAGEPLGDRVDRELRAR